jgi:hypothetical protein
MADARLDVAIHVDTPTIWGPTLPVPPTPSLQVIETVTGCEARCRPWVAVRIYAPKSGEVAKKDSGVVTLPIDIVPVAVGFAFDGRL